jgi:hypothetical protein
LDSNKDGTLSASEIQEYSEGGKNYNAYLENKAFKENVQETLIGMGGSTGITKTFDDQGNPTGTTFQSGNLVTDETGKVIGSLPPGMTFDEFYSEVDKGKTASTPGPVTPEQTNVTTQSSNVTTTPTTTTPDLTTQSIVDAIVAGMENAKANPNVPGTFEVASSGNITSDASGDGGMSSSESAASGGYAETVSGGGEFGGTSSPATSAADYNSKDGLPGGKTQSSSSNNDGGSSGGGGCVIATHGVMTGGFTLMEKAKAELWCQKTYHGKWYGEAFRRGYRAAGQRCIDQGKAREHYQEFKDFVAYGRGVKKGWGLAFKYYMRTIQFFVTGLFIKGD